MSDQGGIGIRPSLPLALQILALVGASLVIAQLVTIGLTLLLPPPTPSLYSLSDIAVALKGAKVSRAGDRPLKRTVLAEPPSYRSPGWVVSPTARAQLAELLGAPADDVRLLFYFPPPPGAGVYPPRAHARPAAYETFQETGADASAQIVKVAFPGPPGAGAGFPPPPGGAAGWPGSMPGGSGGGLGQAGFPGAMPGAGFPGPAGAPPGGVGPRSMGGMPSGAGWGRSAGRGWPGQAASGGDQAVSARDLPLPSTHLTFPGLAPLISAEAGVQTGAGQAAAKAASPPPTDAPALGAPDDIKGGLQTATARPLARTAAPALSTALPRVESAADVSGLIAPAPLIAQKTGDSSGWIVGSAGETGGAARRTGFAAPAFVPGDFIAAVRLADNHWATVQPAPEPFPNRWERRVFLWFATAMLLIAPFAWLFARRLTRPLAAFAAAAEQLGRDPAAAPANLSGPAEVGRAARAFNGMQARLKRFVDDRTAMVGAISHDMRTPLARMRFRLERAPVELKRGMLNDIQQMEDMLNSVLAFIRDASEPADRRRVDLRSIIECAVEDAEMVGGDVVLAPGPPVSVEVDPLAIRRVATNLIDNALKYGRRAEVSLISNGAEVTVSVQDDGPGLGPEEIERVFLPFYRSDAARSMNQGGIGLGLSLSRSIARAHGGDVRLSSRAPGLRADLILPLTSAASAPLLTRQAAAEGPAALSQVLTAARVASAPQLRGTRS